MKRIKILIGVLSAAVIALTVLVAQIYFKEDNKENTIVTLSGQPAVEDMPVAHFHRASYLPASTDNNFVKAAEKTVNSVVHIRTEIVRKGNSYYDFFGPLLEQLYGGHIEVPENVSVGYGSGVVLSPDGYIVTNNHVVDGASKIEVTFNDKHKREAVIIGKDPSTDLALIKVEAEGLEYLTFGNSDDVHIGEWVLAVGNPFNLTSTVTAGIVSAKARNINILGDGSTIESFIQTDAAINPGNSGGTLVDIDGNLIGINAAIASRTGSYEGYSFAIPSNIVRKVVEDFLQYGSLQRAYIGISVVEITQELAEEEDLDVLSGVYVMNVEPTSGAHEAGLKKGDIILSVNGITVDSHPQLIGVIGQYRPGDKVSLKVKRGKNTEIIEVVLKNRFGTEEKMKLSDSFYNKELGLMLQPIPDYLQKELNVNYGLKIVEVKDNTFKMRGIDENFVILSVNNMKVTNSMELDKALKLSKNGKTRIEGVNIDGSWKTTFEFYR